MPSRLLLILPVLLSFALGAWGGRRILSVPPERHEAASADVAPSSPSSLDSAGILLARIEATPTAGLAALHEELADRRWPDVDSLLAYRTLLERCLREDPESLMTAFPLFLNERRTRDLVQVWLEVDAEGLFARIFKDSGPAAETMRREAAFAAPQEFLEAALPRKERVPESDAEIGSAILRLAEADPRVAIAWLDRFALREDTRASKLLSGTPGTQAIHSVHAEVAARLATIDPTAALAWAQARRTPVGRRSVTTAVLASWALTDPDAAAQAFSRVSHALALEPRDIGRLIAATEPELAFRWMQQDSVQNRDHSWIDSLSRYIRDPLLLRRIGSQMTDPGEREHFLSVNLSKWGDRPFDTGLDWALSVPPESRAKTLRALATGIAKIPYDEAIELSARISDESLKEVFLEKLRSNLSDEDPVRLFEIVRSTGDEDILVSTIEWAAYTHAIRSKFPPEEVYAWTRQVDGGFRGDLYEELAQRYYRESPAVAKAWIESLENGSDKDFLLRGLATEMSQRAPETALAWALQYPDPENREEVISGVAFHLSEQRPEKAFHLSLSAPSTHREGLLGTLTRSVRSWAKRDPAAARAAVTSAAGLSDRERQTLASWIYAP